jgi:hypothetical protein
MLRQDDARAAQTGFFRANTWPATPAIIQPRFNVWMNE